MLTSVQIEISDQLKVENAIANLEILITRDQEIGNDLQEFRRQSINTDVHIIAGDEWNQKLFKAHKSILKAQSDYFKVALSDQWMRKDQNGIIIFRKDNISPEVFDLLLDYIYTGKVSVALCNTSFDFVELIEAAEEILLPQLVASLEKYLIDMYLSLSTKSLEIEAWLQSNVVRLVSLKKDIPEGLNLIRSRFEKHIHITGDNSIRKIIPSNMKDAIKSTEYANTILKVFNKYNHMVQTIFNGETSFMASFDEFCRKFINYNEFITKLDSYLLSSYLLVELCDLFLRQNAKNPTIDTNDAINNIINIFKYPRDKGILEESYSRVLAERLLTQCSVSEEAESKIISRLEEECGLDTSKMKLMLHDIGLSKDLNNQFREHSDVDNAEQVYFYVLDSASWLIPPITSDMTISFISFEIAKSFQCFKTFYKNKYPFRRLKLVYHLSNGELKINYLKVPKTFQVSIYQMIILLQYNKSTSYTFNELHQNTSICKSLLNLQLNYLINANILLRECFLDAETEYTLNFEFDSERSRVILEDPEDTMQRMRHERKLRIKELNDKEREKRIHQFEIVALRWAKRRKPKTQYSTLMGDVIGSFVSKFKPKIPEVRKAIDNLIKRNYLERSEDYFIKYIP